MRSWKACLCQDLTLNALGKNFRPDFSHFGLNFPDSGRSIHRKLHTHRKLHIDLTYVPFILFLFVMV
ncbi:unnamed protein product [Coffea canephora]|uniref:Uncharacterized protein n=1 Tax=Coffea canephora TaxID=49390 RepID=A0A068V5C7_COFCA|nr:unnamed protein product [Coffea canephora]